MAKNEPELIKRMRDELNREFNREINARFTMPAHETPAQKWERIAKQQAEYIEAIKELPRDIAVVLRLYDNRVMLLRLGGGMVDVKRSDEFKLKPGMSVYMNQQTGGIVDIVKDPYVVGEISTAVAPSKNGMVEIDGVGSRRAVICPVEAKKDDRLVVVNGILVTHNLGKSDDRFKYEHRVTTTWADIGGLDQAVRDMRDVVELPFQNPEIFKKFGHRPPKGVLLYGPPGCGKTLLAKAVAGSIGEQAGGFIHVKGPEILNMWVGESESRIRSMFSRARAHKEDTGRPAVIFIDEADAVLSRRSLDRAHGGGMSATMVPMFLAEMDGMEESAAIVILATNRSDKLDSAVVRDGRIDKKIYVRRPGKEEAKSIFKIHLKGKPVADCEEYASLFAEALYSDEAVIKKYFTTGTKEHRLKLSNIASGSMIEGLVSRACSIAMHRELETKKSHKLSIKDIPTIINEVIEENRHLDHDETMMAIAKGEA